MKICYLDNSATTAICEGAKRRMEDAIERYGNPSSLHAAGMDARAIPAGAREALLSALGSRAGANAPFAAIFTSCGTESNNLAIKGASGAKAFKYTPHIITTDSEHPSVLETLAALESAGAIEVTRLATKGGAVDRAELERAICERTLMVSIMTVNNETGAIYDVNDLFAAAKRIKPDVITHTDATQGFMKITPDGGWTSKYIDMITVSGHKIHAPKGVAALVVRSDLIKKKRLSPLLCGGGQEDGLRSGTENTVGIAGFHGAIEDCRKMIADGAEERIGALGARFISALPGEVTVNRPARRAPHIISLTLPGIKSQTMLSYLSTKGICVSAGSACASHGNHKSYVLAAFGLTPKQADCTIRVSLSAYTTEDEIDRAAEALAEGVARLVRF